MNVSKYDEQIAQEILETLPEARAALKVVSPYMGRKDRGRIWVEKHARSVALIAKGAEVKQAPDFLKVEANLPNNLDRGLAACLWVIDMSHRISNGGTFKPYRVWRDEE